VIDDTRRTEFELRYGPRGAWAVLFGRAQGFLGTQLLRDEATPGRCLTIDRWQSAEAGDHTLNSEPLAETARELVS